MTDLSTLLDAIERAMPDPHDVPTMADLNRIRELAAAIRDDGGEYRPAYNGHPNRETWNASLWIDNDESTYLQSVAIVREAFRDYAQPRLLAEVMADRPDDERARSERAGAIHNAADALREWWDELNAPDGASPLSDAWSYAVAVVDWRAIADGIADGHDITLTDDDETDETEED